MNKDLEQYFRDEAQSLLFRINSALKTAEARGSFADAVQEVRRYVHTLKGAAHIAERFDVAQQAHALESLIEQVATSSNQTKSISQVLRFTDGIAALLSGDEDVASARASVPTEGFASAAPGETLYLELKDIDEILRHSSAVSNAFPKLQAASSECAEIGSLLEELSELQKNKSQSDSLQLDLVRSIRQRVDLLKRNFELALETLERDHAVLRKGLQELRLTPASHIFIFVERAVRAAAEATGKEVQFETFGGEIELDADILFQLKDSLVQMGKNSVAHGIESPTARRAAGKPAFGTIKLTVKRRGRRITFTVADDGVGINFPKLRERAVERGWLSREAAEKADADQLKSLILRPGFTTSSEVTEVSGRGVGLDLVSDMVARLKGEIRVASEPGRGTQIQLEVPSTVTSVSVLLVRVGAMTVGLPADSVSGTHPLTKLDRVHDAFVLDGSALSLVPLSPFLKAGNGQPRIGIKIAAESPYLLGVDAVVGIEDTKIYFLPSFVEPEAYVLGLSIESEQEVRLIIDPAILRESLGTAPKLSGSGALKPLPILIVDDSLTTRMLEQSIFTTAGYNVELASSGEEGLALAGQNRFGLFVVDVEMPGMDGFDFIARTQQSAALRDVPSILVSSRNSPEDRQRGAEVGAKEYFSKTKFDQKALLERVSQLVGRK